MKVVHEGTRAGTTAQCHGDIDASPNWIAGTHRKSLKIILKL
jgi:hypothetical protein